MTSNPLLQVQKLSKTFPIEGGVFRRVTGHVRAVHQVSFDVQSGEVLAVVGGSGCGKSTLAKMIVHLIPPDHGDIRWEGTSLSALSREDRAHKIQMIFQDPYASLNPKLSIRAQLQEVSRVGGKKPPEQLLE